MIYFEYYINAALKEHNMVWNQMREFNIYSKDNNKIFQNILTVSRLSTTIPYRIPAQKSRVDSETVNFYKKNRKHNFEHLFCFHSVSEDSMQHFFSEIQSNATGDTILNQHSQYVFT